MAIMKSGYTINKIPYSQYLKEQRLKDGPSSKRGYKEDMSAKDIQQRIQKATSPVPKLSPQHIQQIKASPKGHLPPFLDVGVGRGPSTVSVGGHIGPYGGSVGVSGGKPFVTTNYKGKTTFKAGARKGRMYGQ